MTALVSGAVPAVCAAVAALCAVPSRARRPRETRTTTSRRTAPRAGVLVGVGIASGVLLITQPAHRAVLVSVLAGGVVGAVRLASSARASREADDNRILVVDYCEALLGELHAGQPVHRALQRCVAVWSRSEPVAVAAAIGADVPIALHRLADDVAGAEPMHRLAAAWELCASTGAGLAPAVERVLETTRDQLALDRLVQSELASARATARLVALLPVVVLSGAQGIGARPWEFLLSTTAGTVCLGAGLALAFAGLAWIDRIARAARRG